MLAIILSERNIKILTMATIAAAFFGMYFFFYQSYYGFSYLLTDGQGEVFRKISDHRYYKIGLAGIVFSATLLLVLVLSWLYFFYDDSTKDHKTEIAEEVKKIKESTMFDDRDVLYGKDSIDENALRDFVKNHNESAIKYVFHTNIDGSDLDKSIIKLHKQWAMRGMNEQMVKDEICRVLGITDIDKNNPYELLLDLRQVTQGISRKEDIV